MTDQSVNRYLTLPLTRTESGVGGESQKDETEGGEMTEGGRKNDNFPTF